MNVFLKDGKLMGMVLTIDFLGLVLEKVHDKEDLTDGDLKVLKDCQEILSLAIEGYILIDGNYDAEKFKPTVEGLEMYGYALDVMKKLYDSTTSSIIKLNELNKHLTFIIKGEGNIENWLKDLNIFFDELRERLRDEMRD
jgi:hypothetical protein